jgi:hypothetical protein
MTVNVLNDDKYIDGHGIVKERYNASHFHSGGVRIS